MVIRRTLFIIAAIAALVIFLVVDRYRTIPLTVSGIVEADEIRLGSRVGGRVKNVLTQEGEAVHKGDILVELEPYDLLERKAEAEAKLLAAEAEYERLENGYREEEKAQAKAVRDRLAAVLERLKAGPRKQEIEASKSQLKVARQQLTLAEQTFARTEELYKRKAAAMAELDKATEELKNAQSMVEVRSLELAVLVEGTRPEDIKAAEAQLEEAKQAYQLKDKGFRPEEVEIAKAQAAAALAALRSVEKQIEELKILAPVDGVVEAFELQPGDLVSPNAPVLSLIHTGEMWIRAYVPENRLSMELGKKVEVELDSLPGKRFAGHITFISRQAEFTPNNVQTPEERSKQVFRIKVVLEDGADQIRPGMSGDIWLEPAP